jgi:hypothetical protein
MTSDWLTILSEGDLRSLAHSASLLSQIKDQQDFDQLFQIMVSDARLPAMRAADLIEKITRDYPHYLLSHQDDLRTLRNRPMHKELQWHIALLLPRIKYESKEFAEVWSLLKTWAADPLHSRIVRVNALQALYELSLSDSVLLKKLKEILVQLEAENLPSINARIRQFRRKMPALQ